MKTKHKKSGSSDRRLCGLRVLHGRRDEPRTANPVRATPKLNERTGNVYEKKGPVLKARVISSEGLGVLRCDNLSGIRPLAFPPSLT